MVVMIREPRLERQVKMLLDDMQKHRLGIQWQAVCIDIPARCGG